MHYINRGKGINTYISHTVKSQLKNYFACYYYVYT